MEFPNIPGICGAGHVFFLKEKHSCCFKAALAEGTNYQAELSAFSILGNLTIKKGTAQIQILRDSQLVINWVNEKKQVVDFDTSNTNRKN